MAVFCYQSVSSCHFLVLQGTCRDVGISWFKSLELQIHQKQPAISRSEKSWTSLEFLSHRVGYVDVFAICNYIYSIKYNIYIYTYIYKNCMCMIMNVIRIYIYTYIYNITWILLYYVVWQSVFPFFPPILIDNLSPLALLCISWISNPAAAKLWKKASDGTSKGWASSETGWWF
jgi:hypothetical protein